MMVETINTAGVFQLTISAFDPRQEERKDSIFVYINVHDDGSDVKGPSQSPSGKRETLTSCAVQADKVSTSLMYQKPILWLSREDIN